MVAAAVIGGAVVGGVMSSSATKSAAKTAAAAQTQAADQSAAVQLKMFNETKELLKPYVDQGTPAMQELLTYAEPAQESFRQQQALSGLLGPEAQAEMIASIENSPLYQAKVRQGEEAMLQNASATGGLRGGNLQGALAQFRPDMLSAEIEDRYSKLGGFTNLGIGLQENLAKMGQASAAGQAAQGMNTATNLSNIYGNAGQATAQAALARGQANANMWGNIGGSISSLGTLGAMGYGPLG